MTEADSAAAVVTDLERERTPEALASVRKRLGPHDRVLGVRMGTLFAVAKRHTGLPLDEVESLLAHPAYESRLAALHKPVGIFTKHAGQRDRDRLVAFLEAHVAEMARPAVRLAVEKLPASVRTRWV